MDEQTRARVRHVWDIAFNPIAIFLILINILVVYFVARQMMSEEYAQAYVPFQAMVGFILAGVELQLLDWWIRPDYQSSKSLKAIMIVGALAALGVSWWVSSERAPRKPDAQMEDIRAKLRSLPR